jgi:hypothetical protein
LQDFTEEEKAAGLSDPAIKFAEESKSQRSAASRPPDMSTSMHEGTNDGSASHDNKLYDKRDDARKPGYAIGDAVA